MRAGHLRRSGDGPVARQATGCGVPHQRLSALCSPHFFGEPRKTKGAPAPPQTGGGALAMTKEDAAGRTKEHSDVPATSHDMAGTRRFARPTTPDKTSA